MKGLLSPISLGPLRARVALALCAIICVLMLFEQYFWTQQNDDRAGSSTPWTWGSSSSYAREASDVQYRRIVARLERLTAALSNRGDVQTGANANAIGGDRDVASIVQLRRQMDVNAAIQDAEDDLRGMQSGLLPFQAHPIGSKYFITYGDARFNKSRARIVAEAARFGVFDHVRGFGPEDLSIEFVQRNYAILSAPRGGGYWLWKPYIIWETLKSMSDGDVLMYADAGCTFISDPSPYIEIAAQYGLVAFRLGKETLAQYTKGFAFKHLGLDVDIWGEQLQVIAGILVVQKRPFTTFLVSEWLRLSQDERLITDADTTGLEPNHPSFIENRHDQSIWSLLVHKYGAQMILAQRHFPPDAAKIIAATRREG